MTIGESRERECDGARGRGGSLDGVALVERPKRSMRSRGAGEPKRLTNHRRLSRRLKATRSVRTTSTRHFSRLSPLFLAGLTALLICCFFASATPQTESVEQDESNPHNLPLFPHGPASASASA